MNHRNVLPSTSQQGLQYVLKEGDEMFEIQVKTICGHHIGEINHETVYKPKLTLENYMIETVNRYQMGCFLDDLISY